MNSVKKKLHNIIKNKIDKDSNNKFKISYGSYIFAVGLIIALIASFLTLEAKSTRIVTVTLIILGVIIGLFNITKGEAVSFLLATIIFVTLLNPFMMGVVQSFQIQNQDILKILGQIFLNITTLVVPAAMIVAMKTLFQTAKDE